MSRTNGSGPAGPSRVQPSLDAHDAADLPARSDWPSSSSSSSSSYGKGSAANWGAVRATSSTHTIVPEHALEDEWADEEPEAGAAPPEATAASHPAASGPTDPEDYWEDESSSDEDSGSSTHAGRAYRQSRRALARSRSQSLFASIDGSAEPEEHGNGGSDAWRDEDQEEETRKRYDTTVAASAARRGSNTTLAAPSRAGAKQAEEASLALHSPIARHPHPPPPPSSSSSATTTRPRSPSLFLPPPGPLPDSDAQARAYSRNAQTEGLGIQPAPEESTSLATPRTVLKDIRSNSAHSSSYARPHTGASGTGDALGLHGLDLPAQHQQPSIAPSGLALSSEKSHPASSLPPPLLAPHSSTSGPVPALDTPYSPGALAEVQPPSSSSRGANRSPKKGANAKLAGSSESHARPQAQAQTSAQQSANTNGLRSPRLEARPSFGRASSSTRSPANALAGAVSGSTVPQSAPTYISTHSSSSLPKPGQSPTRASTTRQSSFGNSTGTRPAFTTTPSSSAPAPSSEQAHELGAASTTGPFSLWDYLREEVLATDFDAAQELKWERVTNFITIPFWMEKIVAFGFLICLDSFLYTFTIMPLRLCVALWTWVVNLLRWVALGEKRFLSSSHKCDMLKALLVILSCYLLSLTTDASKMYHSVRGQDLLKLYVIFNVLEIADRLCCSFGQDILDTLFSRTTLARRRDGRQPYLRPLAFFAISLGYIMAHTLVLFYQMVTLNVAINSYDNALLSLLVSNQFVEIKGSVFKKFEKENLFQLTCADIVERFQLSLMLSFIAVRNLIELAGAQTDGASGPLPTSFTVLPSFNLLETIFAPACLVLASECLVDWLKHAFITKFNHIRPAVYGRFMDVLCRDLVIAAPTHNSSGKNKTYKHTFVDQSPIVARRLGFAALPMACLLVRVFFQIVSMISDTSHFDECSLPEDHRTSQLARSAAFSLGATDEKGAVHRALQFIAQGIAWILTVIVVWTFLVGVKIILGMNLVSYASKRYASMHEREQEESLNARDRAPIGVHKEEQAYEAKLAHLLDKHDDNAPRHNAHGQQAKNEKGKNASSLLDVSRYTMVRSRIW